jgi:hypothetical protein
MGHHDLRYRGAVDQAELFGVVASDSTWWRLLGQLDITQLG